MKQAAFLFAMFICAIIPMSGYAQIYSYTSATSGAASFVNTNASGTNITPYGGGTNTPCGQGYSGRTGFTASSFSASNPSLGIVVKPNAGYQLNITGFTVRSRKSGTGPANIRLAYSIDGGLNWINKGVDDFPKDGGCATSASGTNEATWNINITVANTTNGIMFRIFPFGATNPTGTIQIWGAFNINGTVTLASTIPVCSPPTLMPTIKHVTCFNGTDGEVALTTVGGTGPFTYAWSGPNSYTSTAQNVTGLKGGNYQVIVAATGGCKDTVDVVVTQPAGVIVPDVKVTASTKDTICAGTPVTFTATPANGGSTPVYQWKKNGGNVGTNANTYLDNILVDGDIITCQLTSSATCAVPQTALSTDKKMTVKPIVTPTVGISASPKTVICKGDPITFTAATTNEGKTPVYKWTLNNVTVGANTATYYSDTLRNGDVIKCEITSNAECITAAKATSNIVTMLVDQLNNSSVTIGSSTNDSVCQDELVKFHCYFTNGGSGYQFQWIRNGIDLPWATQGVYFTDSIRNGDVIQCRFTNGYRCAVPVTSLPINLVVSPKNTPSVSVVATPGNTVPTGASVTFEAKPVNAGSSVTYQWTKNNIAIAGATNSVYNTTSLKSNDKIAVNLRTALPCIDQVFYSSDPIVMKVGTNTNDIKSLSGNIELFPNPNTGKFSVKFDGVTSGKKIQLSIINSVGQLIHKEEMQASGNLVHTLDLGFNIIPGIYIMQIITDEDQFQMGFSIVK